MSKWSDKLTSRTANFVFHYLKSVYPSLSNKEVFALDSLMVLSLISSESGKINGIGKKSLLEISTNLSK